MSLVGCVYLTMVLSLPQRFQISNGEDYWTAGLHLFPMLGGTGLGCFINGPLNRKTNRTDKMAITSSIIILIGTGLFHTLRHADSDLRGQYAIQVVFGLGIGLFFSAATMMTTAQAPEGCHAVAQGIIAQSRVFGGMIGLSIFTIILNSAVRSELAGQLEPDQLEVLYRSPTTVIDLWPELRGRIRETYAEAFFTMTSVLTGVAALALLVSLATLQHDPPAIEGNLYKDSHSVQQSDLGLDDVRSERSVSTTDIDEPTLPVRSYQPPIPPRSGPVPLRRI